MMRLSDLARWLLWGGVLISALANKRHFGLPSTWVFHTIGNTITLLLPDLLRAVSRVGRREGAPSDGHAGRLAPIELTLSDLVARNPAYVLYVAPLALGYIVSHPRFNIYKGEWAELRLAGFGLDSIPHATTAWALTTLTMNAIDTLAGHIPPTAPEAELARWAEARRGAIAALALGLLTIGYEAAEWAIHNAELRATGGDPSRINMEWSLSDTMMDVAANLGGVTLALALKRPATPVASEGDAGHGVARQGAGG
jgi:hypothetical protein